jgi:hypothetical protein
VVAAAVEDMAAVAAAVIAPEGTAVAAAMVVVVEVDMVVAAEEDMAAAVVADTIKTGTEEDINTIPLNKKSIRNRMDFLFADCRKFNWTAQISAQLPLHSMWLHTLLYRA